MKYHRKGSLFVPVRETDTKDPWVPTRNIWVPKRSLRDCRGFISSAKIGVISRRRSSAAVYISLPSATPSTGGSLGSPWARTHTGVDLGDAATDRIIVVGLLYRPESAASSQYCTGITVGGVAATQRVKYVRDAAADFVSELWTASVTTGTTGNIVLQFNGSQGWTGCIAYRLTGATEIPYDSASHASAGTSIDVPANGCVIGVGCSGAAGPCCSPTGVTEDFDILAGASDSSAGGSYPDATSTPTASTVALETERAVRLNFGDANFDSAVFGSFSPA